MPTGPNDPASAYPPAPSGGGATPVAYHYRVTGQTLTSAPADGFWLPSLAGANGEPTGSVSQAEWDLNGYAQADIPVSGIIPRGLYSGYMLVSGSAATPPDPSTTSVVLDGLVFDENQTISTNNGNVFRIRLDHGYVGLVSGLFISTVEQGALGVTVTVAAGPVDWTPSIDIVVVRIAELPTA